MRFINPFTFVYKYIQIPSYVLFAGLYFQPPGKFCQEISCYFNIKFDYFVSTLFNPIVAMKHYSVIACSIQAGSKQDMDLTIVIMEKDNVCLCILWTILLNTVQSSITNV